MDAPLLILITLLVYFITICILKKNGFKHKISSEYSSNCCPECQKPLERVKRNYSDKLANLISFKMFNFKRYICKECNWQGLRWEYKFKRKF